MTERPGPREPHPLCNLLRTLRRSSGLSLQRFEDRSGISAVVIGSYERGDRVPSAPRLDEALRHLGYRLTAVPIDQTDPTEPLSHAHTAASREHLAQQLRLIADCLTDTAQ